MINWKIEKRNIDDLRGYDKNPRRFTEKGLKDLKKSLENLGDANIITINADNTVLGGHARLQVMRQLGYKEVDVKVADRVLDEDTIKEVVIRLNANTAGEWNDEMLEKYYEKEELIEWGLDVPNVDTTIEEDKESKYTRKVSLPIYEITGEEPTIDEMIDTKKADKYCDEIMKADIPQDIKEFLMLCCTRLYEFDYGKIAEYYAHQDKNVQELMEKIALVLIDLNSAIENGYVELNKFIENCFLEDKDKEDADE